MIKYLNIFLDIYWVTFLYFFYNVNPDYKMILDGFVG